MPCRTWQEWHILYLGTQTELFGWFTFHLDLDPTHSTAACFFSSMILAFSTLQNMALRNTNYNQISFQSILEQEQILKAECTFKKATNNQNQGFLNYLS